MGEKLEYFILVLAMILVAIEKIFRVDLLEVLRQIVRFLKGL